MRFRHTDIRVRPPCVHMWRMSSAVEACPLLTKHTCDTDTGINYQAQAAFTIVAPRLCRLYVLRAISNWPKCALRRDCSSSLTGLRGYWSVVCIGPPISGCVRGDLLQSSRPGMILRLLGDHATSAAGVCCCCCSFRGFTANCPILYSFSSLPIIVPAVGSFLVIR